MKRYLLLINDFAHDFFSALWLSCLLVLGIIVQQSSPVDSELATRLLGTFFQLQSWSMLFIILTGIGRYLHVKGKMGQGDGQDQARRSILIVKHAIMGVIFLGGTILGYSWAS